MLAIKGGKIFTMAGRPIDNGVLLIEKDKIKGVGRNIKIPRGTKVINAGGKFITPGLIDAHCHTAIFGEGSGYYDDLDGNEMTHPITPHLRALDAFNPNDMALPELVKAGVTTILTGPGSGNVVGGQSIVVKTVGRNVDRMVIKTPAGMKMALGQNPKKAYGGRNKIPSTRMGNAAVLRESLTKAQTYLKKWSDYNKKLKKDKAKAPEKDIKMEALGQVLKREIRARIHCHRSDDILTAIRIADEFKLNITIEHATEAAKIVDILAKKNIPCVVGPMMFDRLKEELKDRNLATPGILSKAGVKVAIQTDGMSSVQFLNISAALAVREGMPEEDALKAITINAAEIADVGDRVGSLEPGKDADVVIFSAHPLDVRNARTEIVIIDGQIVFKR
ncbi:MAG: amidohydrolase [Planctomycetes bacterium]|nr:amidohydrolase [Planctomycetota bacterium]